MYGNVLGVTDVADSLGAQRLKKVKNSQFSRREELSHCCSQAWRSLPWDRVSSSPSTSASPTALGHVSGPHWCTASGSSCPPCITKGSCYQGQIPSAVTDKTRQLETLHLPLIPYIYRKFFINPGTWFAVTSLQERDVISSHFFFYPLKIKCSLSEILFHRPSFFVFLCVCDFGTNFHGFLQFHQLCLISCARFEAVSCYPTLGFFSFLEAVRTLF